MRSFRFNLKPADGDPLTGQSKWWGQPDMPDDLEYPMIPYEDGDDDPMTFVCQIRCADLADLDTEDLLPHEGMLYFFADIDDYVGELRDKRGDVDDDDDYDNYGGDYFTGMGEWGPGAFKVLYSPHEEDLHTHRVFGPDGEPYCLPAERVTFEVCEPNELSTRLLGEPFEIEVAQEFPEHISLLQLWEEDRWRFFMYDCGILSFLILPEDLKARRFDCVKVYLHSC